MQGLRTLLPAYAGGAKDADAFAKAFGRSVDEVEASFKTFVDERFGALARAMADPPSRSRPTTCRRCAARRSRRPATSSASMALGIGAGQGGRLGGARRRSNAPPSWRRRPAAPAARARCWRASPSRQATSTAPAGNCALLLTFDHDERRRGAQAGGRSAAMRRRPPTTATLRCASSRISIRSTPTTHVQLGRRLFAKGSYAPALMEFQAALALGPPNLAEAHTDLAKRCSSSAGRTKPSGRCILALQQAPTYARAQDVLLAILGRQ